MWMEQPMDLERKKINVKVGGEAFTLYTDSSEEHMRTVAAYVDEVLANLRSKHNMLSHRMVLMAAIQIADELLRVKEERNDLLRNLKSPSYALSGVRREMAELSAEHHRFREVYERTIYTILKAIDESEKQLEDENYFRGLQDKVAPSLKDRPAPQTSNQLVLDEVWNPKGMEPDNNYEDEF